MMRAALFDLGNTLVSYYAAADFAPILRKCVRACIRVLESSARLDEDEILRQALTLNIERADHTVWPLAERLRILFGSDLAAPIQDRLIAAFLDPIFATAVVDPEALSTLAALRERGVATAIVSNTPWGSPAVAWRAELVRHNLLTAVDAVVFCEETGFRKPHRAPFEHALKLLRVHATDAVFIGDDPRWDVSGAEGAGIQPILLMPHGTEPVRDSVPIARTLADVLTALTTRA
jgi:HAD superfamily hydrolase (TIGR01509 family)